jgi:HAD superfamily hydrolase (TIGR01509 family)
MVSTEWGRTTKRLVIVGLVIILLLFLYVFRTLLPPILLAFVLAYILKPLADWVEKRLQVRRTLAVVLVYVVVLAILSIVPVTVVPYAVDRITRLNLDVQKLTDDLVGFLSQPFMLFGYLFSLGDFVGDVRGAVQNILQPFATRTVNLVFNVLSSLLWVMSIAIISFYLVKDADRLRQFLDRMAPPGYTEELRHLREEINHVWKAFFRGQMVLGFVVGVVVWIAMSIVGLPNAGLMGIVAGLLEAVPTFGPVLATIPAVLIAFFIGSVYLPLSNFWFTVLVLGVYVIIQQVENAYLVPRIMGRRMQLHPVVIFIGVLAGGTLGGTLGVLLAAPVIGTLRVVLGYVYAKLLDQDPFPSAPPELGELYPGEIDAILFDLDGTLIEADEDAVQALAHRLATVRWLLRRRDPAQVARRVIMAWEGPANSLLSLLERVGLDDGMLDLGDRLYRLRALETPHNFQPVDGMVDTLHDLSRRYHLALITTRSRLHAQAFVRQQHLDGLIEVIAAREDTWRLKPHAGSVRYAAEKLRVPLERCLVVGDTVADIQAAQAAGARAAGVLTGFGSRADLERAGADLVFDTVGQLKDWM